LDPADAIDDEQRVTARFQRSARQFKLAVAAGESESAIAAVAEMETVAREVEKEWTRRLYFQTVLGCHADLKGAEAVKRCLRVFDKHDRDEILDAETLLGLGMKAEAVARARRDIQKELKELADMTDPNIHFPVMAISRALEFLVRQGA